MEFSENKRLESRRNFKGYETQGLVFAMSQRKSEAKAKRQQRKGIERLRKKTKAVVAA